jgi:hypothetical protein
MGKGPTRRQGSGQSTPDSVKNLKRSSREIHKDVNQNSAGPQSSKKGAKGYNRKQKHKNSSDETIGEELTPIDETYRGGGFPIAKTLNWQVSARRGSGFATGRPCGDDEQYPGKCGDGGGLNGGGQEPHEYPSGGYPDDWGIDEISLYDATHTDPGAEDYWAEQEQLKIDDPEGYQAKHGDELARTKEYREETERVQDGGGGMQYQQEQREQQLGRPMDVNEFMQFKNDWEAENPHQAAQKQSQDKSNRQNALDDFANPEQEPEYKEPSGYNVGPGRYTEGRTMRSNIAADLTWSTHKSETFDDDGEDGGVSSWGLKSIIDRGVQPHEKSSGADSIEDAENQTQQRDIPSKKFKSFSMVGAFDW